MVEALAVDVHCPHHVAPNAALYSCRKKWQPLTYKKIGMHFKGHPGEGAGHVSFCPPFTISKTDLATLSIEHTGSGSYDKFILAAVICEGS